jgi:uncharacterized membrane protein YedE/YeeE
MTEFTPWSGLAGGALIGLASAILLLSLNRIAGISGITFGVLQSPAQTERWRWMFIAGLLLGTVVFRLAGGDTSQIAFTPNILLLVAGGLLVGFGTRMCSGCTSGHGVCGISRGSVRSIVATAVFMASGALTVYVVRHLLGDAS